MVTACSAAGRRNVVVQPLQTPQTRDCHPRYDDRSGGPAAVSWRDRNPRTEQTLRPHHRRQQADVHRPPGHVTGFLGPNGSGKSTTLRLILGLNDPSGGTVTVDGRAFREHKRGLRYVGALLDASDVHGGRSARAHLSALAASNDIPARRVAEVLEEVGLASAARRRIEGFSLGMKQRVGIATALLGDPPVLMFDEPFNGLDAEGAAWVRGLFRRLAEEGRTVFVSSHLMAEMELLADRLVVIGRGELIADEAVEEFAARSTDLPSVVVRAAVLDELADLQAAEGASVRRVDGGTLVVIGLPASRISELAFERRVLLHEVATRAASLEDVFMERPPTASSTSRGNRNDHARP
jgi:ABC-2 type transport system ATP-binding protein